MFSKLQRRVHSNKTTREPPQVKNLTRLLFTAMRHLKEIYCGDDFPEARLELADYPEYGSAKFAEAADCTQEVLSPPTPPHLARHHPDRRNRTVRRPRMIQLKRTAQLLEISLPTSTATSRTNWAASTPTTRLTSFCRRFTIPKAPPRVASNSGPVYLPVRARASLALPTIRAPTATKRPAPRPAYLGLPQQLVLCENDRSAARRIAAIKGRPNAFLNGDYKVPTQL